ncbi:hypothetical protein FA15DRAFT_760686 [Coprinopsis marcescibilis]|uniref:DUF6533 domain-containing protein n=1 Tax=Coprinopsis marcescibilis TaxID=230819 RepID=A0A5C3KE62_COPMA|nr:hypothetical protein FA15DRAFT_760686 [Coprinopsis marcescibilis]
MEVPPLRDLVWNKRIASDLQVAVGTILVIDYLQTFASEVKHIWHSPWSAIKILYLLARYSPFLDAGLIIRYYLTETADLSPQTCRTFLIAGTISVIVTVAFAEAILFIRVYALSGQSKFMRAYLVIQYLVTHVAELALMAKLTSQAGFPIIPGITEHIGCTPSAPPHTELVMRVIFGLFVFNGAVLVVIMAWLCYKRFCPFRVSHIAFVFMRDGFLYFVVIAVIGVVNIIVSVETRATNFVLGESHAIFHSIMACRLVIHLREVATDNTTVEFDRDHRLSRGTGNGVDESSALGILQFGERSQAFTIRGMRDPTNSL